MEEYDYQKIAEKKSKLFKDETKIFLPDDFNEDLYNEKPIFQEGVEKITFGNNFTPFLI